MQIIRTINQNKSPKNAYKMGKVAHTTTATIKAGIQPSTQPKKLKNMIAVSQVPKKAIMAESQAPSYDGSLLLLIINPNYRKAITLFTLTVSVFAPDTVILSTALL